MSNNESFHSTLSEESQPAPKSTPISGLSALEASARLKEYGENTFDPHYRSELSTLLGFLWGPIPWMIEAAAILAFALHRWPDFFMILTLLVIHSAIGFIQEHKADSAIHFLKDSLALRAHVLRGKKWRDIDAKLLVPGDVVQVKTGHIIPADLELISGEYLYVDESTLSGESSYVDKIVGDTAYSGTLVQEGDMLGIVTKTGKETRFGKTAELLDRTKTRSRFRASLIQIGNILIAFTVSAALLMLLTDLYRIYIEKSSTETLGGLIIFVLVVMIAGIPVALPAVFSVTLSVGAARIGRFKSIVTRLSVIEELAGMDVLCCDKTGVFTKNSPTVHQIKVFDDHTTEQEVLLVAALASHPERRDVLDNAIIVALNQDTLLSQYSQEKIIPFDSARKRVETIVITPEGQHIRCVKGAPQVVLALTRPNEALATSVMAEIDSFAARGFRTLGVARQIDQTWTFLGLIPLFDPLRPETVPFLRHAKELGISVKMLTGDHIAIATQISRGLELGEHVFPMSSITEEPTKTQENQIANADGFAEASPEDKYTIVKALQDHGRVIGITGSKVQDAPTLKQANIGIAISGAMDASKAAADLVLTEPGLEGISHAVEEARKVFGRMRSYTQYRISETIRIVLFLLLSMFVYNAHPLSALMIVMIALLNDIPIMMIAYDNMPIDKKPLTWEMKELVVVATAIAMVGVLSTFGLYWIGENIWGMNVHQLATLSFMAILCGGNLTIYITRNTGTIWSLPLPELKLFLATTATLIIGTLVSVYGLGANHLVGLGWHYVLLAWGYLLIWFVMTVITKSIFHKSLGHGREYHISSLEKQVQNHMHNVGL